MSLEEILALKRRKRKRRSEEDVMPEIPVIGKREKLRRALEKGGPGSGPRPGGGGGEGDPTGSGQKRINDMIAHYMDQRSSGQSHSQAVDSAVAASKKAGASDKELNAARAKIKEYSGRSENPRQTHSSKAVAAARERESRQGPHAYKSDLREKIRKAFDSDKHPRAGGKFDAHANDTNKVKTLKDGTRRIFVKGPEGERLRKYWKPGEPDTLIPKGQARTLLKKALQKGGPGSGPRPGGGESNSKSQAHKDLEDYTARRSRVRDQELMSNQKNAAYIGRAVGMDEAHKVVAGSPNLQAAKVELEKRIESARPFDTHSKEKLAELQRAHRYVVDALSKETKKADLREKIRNILSKGKGHPGPSQSKPDDEKLKRRLKGFLGNVPHSQLGSKV
jgi:hypothetical protein